MGQFLRRLRVLDQLLKSAQHDMAVGGPTHSGIATVTAWAEQRRKTHKQRQSAGRNTEAESSGRNEKSRRLPLTDDRANSITHTHTHTHAWFIDYWFDVIVQQSPAAAAATSVDHSPASSNYLDDTMHLCVVNSDIGFDHDPSTP